MAKTKKSTSKAPTKKAPVKTAKKAAKQPSKKAVKRPSAKKKKVDDAPVIAQPDATLAPNLLTGTTLDEGLKDPRVKRSKKERDPEDVQRHRQIRSALTSKTITL